MIDHVIIRVKAVAEYHSTARETPHRNCDVDGKRILIVEDDYTQRSLLKELLSQAGFEVTALSDGLQALTWMQNNGLPHMAVLDLGLPNMHGFTLSERIKRMGDVPIVFITGDRSTESEQYGLENFSEDYITKPFVPEIVVARIRRIMSRFPDGGYAAQPRLTIDRHLSIDFPNNLIVLDGMEIPLTPTETGLLYLLVRHRGQVVPPETLMDRVWPNDEVFEETLRVHMHRLRRKIQPDEDSTQYIRTERGVGYAFFVADDNDAGTARL